jgi:hypothetical protein
MQVRAVSVVLINLKEKVVPIKSKIAWKQILLVFQRFLLWSTVYSGDKHNNVVMPEIN